LFKSDDGFGSKGVVHEYTTYMLINNANRIKQQKVANKIKQYGYDTLKTMQCKQALELRKDH